MREYLKEEYVKEKLSRDNTIEQDLLIEGWALGNAYTLVDILQYIEQNPNISVDGIKEELIGTIDITKYAKEMYKLK